MNAYTVVIGDSPLSVETDSLAKQANGSALVRYGDTVVLVTATMSPEPRPGMPFFPLLVDYEEKMYAIGRIPGGFIKREGRPSEFATLSARMIDRSIRPLFPDGMRNDVQVVATVLSVDKDNPPDVVAMVGASLALSISDIPFAGPIGSIRVGRINGEFIANPTYLQQDQSDMNLVVSGNSEAILMVEAGANELPEEVILDGIMWAHKQIQSMIYAQEQMIAIEGKEKTSVPLVSVNTETESWVQLMAEKDIVTALQKADITERQAELDKIWENTKIQFSQAFGEELLDANIQDIHSTLDALMKKETRRLITVEHQRPDGRSLDEIRPITCGVSILPRAHGSGIFTRGQTQVLTSCALGVKRDEQIIDDLRSEDRKRFIHHYNFPSFSVGEVRPMRGPARREIGHGALAERALVPVIPQEDEFPYTIRLVSEVLESNGSSSQASICGSTLALLDAGVPIKRPVAGIAMGLVKEGEHLAILTDIQGIEDHEGDMDFKVAGTRDGITALQMDIKISGVSRQILMRALQQAKEARLFILDKMSEVIQEPRESLSPYAPRIISLNIPVEKIRDVIGPGGKTIRSIIDETGAQVDIDDDGRVYISSTDGDSGEQARQRINLLIKDVEVGEVYTGIVTKIMNFGAFVEVLPGKEGLVHISKLEKTRVEKVEDIVSLGDRIPVKVIEIDQRGRINLSRRDAL